MTQTAVPSAKFTAITLAFDALVEAVRTEGVTERVTSLIAELDRDAIHLMRTPHLVNGNERRAACRIEDTVFKALRGRETSRGFVPYTAEQLLCLLIAGAHHSPDVTPAVAKTIAEFVTEGFTRFPSAADIIVFPGS